MDGTGQPCRFSSVSVLGRQWPRTREGKVTTPTQTPSSWPSRSASKRTQTEGEWPSGAGPVREFQVASLLSNLNSDTINLNSDATSHHCGNTLQRGCRTLSPGCGWPGAGAGVLPALRGHRAALRPLEHQGGGHPAGACTGQAGLDQLRAALAPPGACGPRTRTCPRTRPSRIRAAAPAVATPSERWLALVSVLAKGMTVLEAESRP